ncbi:hypothetical protein [Deinococcus sp. YIM 77859]|uniref:hypothetical protein n=1 Tax=Deinococcus sp. YIM 77859 TaxID=1540221 RepID=UPI000ACCA53E|nr:hypothetical protein [Deinococcus sp. YIM 77859]
MLLRLKVGSAPRLGWLNPGADRTLAPGETVTLRYRLEGDADLGTLRLPAGLTGEWQHLPGGREVALRLTNTALVDGQRVTPALVGPAGHLLRLPPVTGGALSAPRPLALLGALLGLLAAALLFVLFLRRPRARSAPAPVFAAPPPQVRGLRYGEDRTLALLSADGTATPVPIPLGSPFDLGQLARVPHLSGLRFQQDRLGLRLLRLPPDLEIHAEGRSLGEGEVLAPGPR